MNKIKKTTTLIFPVIIFSYFYLLSIDTPSYDDDLYISNHQTIATLFQQAYNDYFNWNGRVVGQSAWRIIVSSNIFVSAFLIAFFALSLILLIQYFSKTRNIIKYSLLSFLLSFFSVILFSPVIGQIFFWKAGAGNYLLTTVVILTFILPFHDWYQEGTIKKSLLYYLLPIIGFIAGWSNENTSGGALLIVFIYIILGRFYKKISNKYKKLEKKSKKITEKYENLEENYKNFNQKTLEIMGIFLMIFSLLGIGTTSILNIQDNIISKILVITGIIILGMSVLFYFIKNSFKYIAIPFWIGVIAIIFGVVCFKPTNENYVKKEEIKLLEEKIKKVVNLNELYNLKLEYLGKKGRITEMMASLKELTIEQKKIEGQKINEIKKLIIASKIGKLVSSKKPSPSLKISVIILEK